MNKLIQRLGYNEYQCGDSFESGKWFILIIIKANEALWHQRIYYE